MIYLASPYTHPDPSIREQRFDAACRAMAQLVQRGEIVYAPVVCGHSLAEIGLPTDWQFWRHQNEAFLEIADELFVLTVDGWQESVGVQREITQARELGVSIWHLDPGTGSPTLAHVRLEALS